MHTQVADIDFLLTGSELVALLIENEEIKNLKPKFNSALKRSSFPYSIVSENDLFGYQHLKIEKTNENKAILAAYSTQGKAKAHLEKLVREFNLCLGLCSLQKCGNGCVSHSVGSCQGAALYSEDSDAYNERVKAAISQINPINRNMLIIDKSTNPESLWAVLIQNGDFVGLGQFELEFSQNIDMILDSVQWKEPNPDSRHIISSYLRTKRVKKIIDLD
jgi:DNA polymerase-3 subunit epsilon